MPNRRRMKLQHFGNGSSMKSAAFYLVWTCFMSKISMLPSVAVAPVSVFPPYASIANPFRFRHEIEGAASVREKGVDDFVEGEDNDRDFGGRSGVSLVVDTNDSFLERKTWSHSDISIDCPARLGDQAVPSKDVNVQSSELLFVMSRPGYTKKVSSKSMSKCERRVGSALVSGMKLGTCAASAPASNLLLSNILARDSCQTASAGVTQQKRSTASSVKDSSTSIRFARETETCSVKHDRKLETAAGQRVSVTEGAARLKELSALMTSLREFQERTASQDASKIVQAGLPQIQRLLDGFSKLNLNAPAALVSSIPATAELKGALVTRLGGLRGRYEVANYSSAEGVVNARLQPVSNGHSWHARTREPDDLPPLPPDDWLESGDREHKLFILVASRFLSYTASIGDQAMANHDPSDVAKMRASPFWAHKPPKISLEDYCARIAKFCACSSGNFLLAMLYLDRFLAKNPGYLITSRNVHRLFLTSLLVATKQWDDHHYDNAFWAKAGGISNAELNSLETSLMTALNWHLFVDKREFDDYESLASQLGRALGVLALIQTAPSTPVPAPCSGAVDPVSAAHSLTEIQSPAIAAEGECVGLSSRPHSSKTALQPECLDDGAVLSGSQKDAVDKAHIRATSCSPLESHAAAGGDKEVSAARVSSALAVEDASPPAIRCKAGDEEAKEARDKKASVEEVVDDRGVKFDMQVLRERLQQLKESRPFRRAAAESTVSPLQDARTTLESPRSWDGGRSERRPSVRRRGPLFAAMERMLSEALSRSGPSEPAEDGGESGRQSLSYDAAGKLTGGSSLERKTRSHRRITVKGVGGWETVPAA